MGRRKRLKGHRAKRKHKKTKKNKRGKTTLDELVIHFFGNNGNKQQFKGCKKRK